VRRWLGLLCFCAFAVVLRVTWSGVGEYRQAEAEEAAGDLHEAAIRYGRAIRMYLPGFPVPGRAGDRLLALAAAHEAAGDPREARFCLEELRSGFLSVRGAWQPGRRFVEEAERRLVPLMLADPRGDWPPRAQPESERAAEVRRVLGEREEPALIWVLVMGLGYALWLGGAGAAIVRGLPDGGGEPVRWRVMGRWAGVSALGYGLWLLGVAQA
jgi:hypothetical protein